jgi:hypothetical protein
MTNKIKNIRIFFIILLILFASFTTIVNAENNTYQNVEKITNTLVQQKQNIALTHDTLEINNLTKNYWAVLIGINNYPGTQNDLPFSVNEITGFQKTLLSTKNWKQSHIKTITDNNATNASFINAIEWLDENEDSNDVTIFYFAGHGSNNSDGHAYIRLFDAKITDEELDKQLDNLEGNVIVILDSCDSGGFIQALHQDKRVILTACSKDELAYQDYNLQNGIFGYYLNLSLKLAKSAEIAFLYTYPLCIYYGKKISQEYNTDYTFHPVIDDNTIGLTKIITWRKFLPSSSVNITAIVSKFRGLKIWIL